MRFPQTKHVRGTPRVDQAYVCSVLTHRQNGPNAIETLAVGVISPAYKSDDKPAPRGIHMTLSQAESFAFVVLERVCRARRWNREQTGRKG